MSGLTWAVSGVTTVEENAFTEVTGTFVFTDDDVRAFYVDWDDGPSNKKTEANYQWVQSTETKSSYDTTHLYTTTGTFNPVIQTLNSSGFFSKYVTSGTAGLLGVNTEVSPSIGDTGITKIDIKDGVATGIMRVENKTVKSGIDNSIFNKEGGKTLYLMIPPLCTRAELTIIDSITIEVEAMVEFSLVSTGANTDKAGAARSIQTLTATLADLDTEATSRGLIEIPITGGTVVEVLKMTYKNPKYVVDPLDYDSNDAYKNLKIFLVVAGSDALFYPIAYVSAGAPIKKAHDSLRNITMDFSQSRAKASNVSLSSYRYDDGKMWLNPVEQWVVSGATITTLSSGYFGDQTEQTSELKNIAYTYMNVRPDGLSGHSGNSLYVAFTDNVSGNWDRDNSTNDQRVRVDQFIVDEFGRFTDQYHMVRMSADPSTTDKDDDSNVSPIYANQPYVLRVTPVGTNWRNLESGNKGGMTKIDPDFSYGFLTASGQNSRNYSLSGASNSSTSQVLLSGMNRGSSNTSVGGDDFDNTWKNIAGYVFEDGDIKEYLILLFSSKTNKLFFNMSNYANQLMDMNLAGSSHTYPWSIADISYLAIDNSGATSGVRQHAHWKPLEFDDTTKVSMEYRDTSNDKYVEQSNALSQSGYITYSMPSDWSAASLTNLCGGEYNVTSGFTAQDTDIVITVPAGDTTDLTNSDFGGVLKCTGMTGDDVTGGVIDEAALGTADDIGAFKYIAFIADDYTGGGSVNQKPLWVASGAANGVNDDRDELYLTYGYSTDRTGEDYEPDRFATGGDLDGEDLVLTIRRVNIYDVITGFSRVECPYLLATPPPDDELLPVDAQGGAWGDAFPCRYMFNHDASNITSFTTAWKTTDFYALKITLGGAAGGTVTTANRANLGPADISDTRLYPNLWNIFDATQASEVIIKQIDDSGYNLNALPVTSDISVSRGGTYYSAITRKGKVFIARTGDKIENISFSSVALGDGTFDDYSTDSSMYGQLRKVRNLHARTCRVYWDEPQKDGTFVRYWGVVTQVEETHGTGGPRSIINYNFNVMIEEIALIAVGGTLMTDVFPLGGVSDGLDFS